MLSIMIYVLIAFIGFASYRMCCQKYSYHGPVANDVIKYIYLDNETNKYYRFNIKMFICPPSFSKEYFDNSKNDTVNV